MSEEYGKRQTVTVFRSAVVLPKVELHERILLRGCVLIGHGVLLFGVQVPVFRRNMLAESLQ